MIPLRQLSLRLVAGRACFLQRQRSLSHLQSEEKSFSKYLTKFGVEVDAKALEKRRTNEVYDRSEEMYLQHEMKLMEKSKSPAAEDAIDWNAAMHVLETIERALPPERVDKEALMDNLSTLSPTHNVAKVIGDCPTLQRLVDLGVDLSKWEKDTDNLALAMSASFEEDVAPRLRFLVDNGVGTGKLGAILTENPELLKVDLDDMRVRVNYLKWKTFNDRSIAKILNASPKWLNKSVVDVDRRLGYFQQTFALSGPMVRQLATNGPDLVIWPGVPMQVERNRIAITNDMEFSDEEAAQILVKAPDVYDNWNEDWIIDTHSVLKGMYTNQVMLHSPAIITRPKLDVKHKHLFLKFLKRDQYDPKKPNFVPPKAFLVDDKEFCKKAAKAPLSLYNKFMLTM